MSVLSVWYDVFRQCFFIPPPTLTENNLPDQAGRVFIVTGGYAGCGKVLSKILYQRNGTVYIAGRSKDKADKAIDEIKAAHPSSHGRVEFLQLDLADLSSIKKSVDDFTRREQRLDVLTNNAGVMIPPAGSQTAQGFELQMGTNCLGPFLFTELLTPLLEKTAANSPRGSVRVTWAASLATMGSPTHGITWDPQSGNPKIHGRERDYAQSKACNVLLAQAYQRRHADAGILSLAWNPGNLNTELQRHSHPAQSIIYKVVCYDMYYGGLTELYAGWSEDALKEENRGGYVGPWGRFCKLRADLRDSPQAEKFWEWCDKTTKEFR